MWSDLAIFCFKTMCAAVTIFCVVAAIYTAGPALETKYWPVVSKLRIISTEETPEGFIKLRVQFTKLRACEYIGLAWYVGERPDNFERVAVSVMRDPHDVGSPNRPLGTQKAGPWIVAISSADFYSNSFAQLQHRCHPFWTTTTEFYP